MFHVFSTIVYDLLDPGSTLFFGTPLLALTFEALPVALRHPTVVSSPLGENVRADRVHKDFPIVACRKTMCEDLVDLHMNNFDIILGMD